MNFANTRWYARGVVLLLALAGTGLAAGVAHAQSYPNKAVTLIVPYGPGTGIDVVGRIIAQKVSETWTYPIVVMNRPGATGSIGVEMAAKAPPDGYTIVISATSQIVNQQATKVRYDLEKDFAPVSLTASQPLVVAVSSSSPVKTMDELVALARSKPGKINYAGQAGSVFHFMGEMLKSARGIDIVMISYKSTTDALADLIAGRVEIWLTQLPTAAPQVKAGKVRVLGVSGEKRAALLPDAPTMVEAGVPTLDVNSTLYVLAPAATPKTIVNALNSEIAKALGTEEVRDRLAGAGFEPKGGTPEDLGAFLKTDLARWGKVIKESGVRIE